MYGCVGVGVHVCGCGVGGCFNCVSSCNLQALSLAQLNRHSEAEWTLEQAITHFPHSPDPPKHLASIFLQQGRLEEVHSRTLQYAR